jgi:hypothetical protein
MALLLEKQGFVLLDELRYLDFLFYLLSGVTQSITWAATFLDEFAEATASIAFLFFMKERVDFDAFAFAGVALGTDAIFGFALAVAGGADHILLVLYLMATFLLCINNLLNIDIYHNMYISAIPAKWIMIRFFFVLLCLCLMSPLFPHIEEVLIDEIIIIHKPLFPSFFFSSFHFFRVWMVIVIMTLLSHRI